MKSRGFKLLKNDVFFNLWRVTKAKFYSIASSAYWSSCLESLTLTFSKTKKWSLAPRPPLIDFHCEETWSCLFLFLYTWFFFSVLEKQRSFAICMQTLALAHVWMALQSDPRKSHNGTDFVQTNILFWRALIRVVKV